MRGGSLTAYGYVRVSTVDQNPQLQFDALHALGIDDDQMFVDHISGSTKTRPALDRLMDVITEGDEVVVWKLDRLGRSTQHLIETIEAFKTRGVAFKSVTDPVDTTTPAGNLVFQIFAALAEFERALIVERTHAGLEAARAKGKHGGRKSNITPEAAKHIRKLHDEGWKIRPIAKVARVSPSAVSRLLRGEIQPNPDAGKKKGSK